MLFVGIVIFLIILIVLVLIFGGKVNNTEQYKNEQEDKKKEKVAKKEIKEKGKNIRNVKNNYVDIFKAMDNEVNNGNAINEDSSSKEHIEAKKDYEEKNIIDNSEKETKIENPNNVKIEEKSDRSHVVL